LVPREQVSTLVQERDELEAIVNDDNFDGEFGSEQEQMTLKRYKQLLHLLWDHDIAIVALGKIVTTWQTNFKNNVLQEYEFNEAIVTNILAKSLGDTYHELSQ